MTSPAVAIPNAAVAADRRSLTALANGEMALVVEVLGDPALIARLVAAGLWTGARVECIGRAPFGDPLLFRLHGYRLALRASEAAAVITMPVATALESRQ